MITKSIKVMNENGLHARPAAELCRVTSQFNAEVVIKNDDMEVNGKSVMGVMMLAAEFGTELTFSLNGDDEQEAWVKIVELFEKNFHE
ncbi:MAG: HPr family phosphocarrier protein [Calditrichaeota bacterium]|nr:HPr family phosphocarrier protein [Calditrichota bacterium]